MSIPSKLMKKIGPETDLISLQLLSSGAFGARVRNALLDFLSERGFQISKKTEKGPYHKIINDQRIVIKTSTLWSGEHYTFQQIKDGLWDYLICVGISPEYDHLWIADYDSLKYTSGQHTGAQATETKWIMISPQEKNHPFLKGGTIEEGLKAIHDALD